MKRLILSTLLTLSLPFTTNLKAETPSTEPPPSQEEVLPPQELPVTPILEESPVEEDLPPPPPREVGRASTDGYYMGKQKNLGNIAIALLAVVVAVTAILLVSKNEGKHA